MRHQSLKAQSGFSIVELLVASVIGLMVLAGAVAVFSSNSASGKVSSGVSRIQDSGRVAIDILSNDIRMAGYQGCADSELITANVIATVSPTIDLPASALQGAEYDGSSWNPAMPADLVSIAAAPLPGTDILYLQHGSGRTTLLQTSMLTTTQTSISLVSNPDHLAVDDLVMISDCTSVDVFRATSVGNSSSNIPVTFSATSNTQANLSSIYTVSGDVLQEPMRVMRFHASAYYVANTPRRDINNNLIPALYVLDLSRPNPTPVELVEGVENLQLLYGEVLDDGRVRYLPASDAALVMENVTSVQIGLLVSSIENSASDDDDGTYQVADQRIGHPASSTLIKHSGGRKLRTAFNTTVRVRNQR